MIAANTTITREARSPSDDPVSTSLVLVLECARVEASSSRHELGGLEEVLIGRGPARRWSRRERTLVLEVPDPQMSQRHARLHARRGRWMIEDRGSKNGVLVGGVQRQALELAGGDVIELGQTVFLLHEGVPAALPPDVAASELHPVAPALRTFNGALERAFSDLARVAGTDAPIAIHGETGTGKELLARAAHALAGRSGPLVAVNCGALPATLIESELFGSVKGSFSGATEDRPGLIRSAHGGTLFLDEIGDLSLPAQAALLRALQGREVLPVGGTRPVAVDFRLVAATHHDLEASIAAGTFRRDLYARISAFTVVLPALRERREDFGILAAAISARRPGLALAADAARALLAHDWPDNIRGLDAVLGVAFTLARGGPIKLEHLPERIRRAGAAAGAAGAASRALLPDDDTERRDELVRLLVSHQGNISAIARALGRSRIQVHRLLERYGLELDAYRAK